MHQETLEKATHEQRKRAELVEREQKRREYAEMAKHKYRPQVDVQKRQEVSDEGRIAISHTSLILLPVTYLMQLIQIHATTHLFMHLGQLLFTCSFFSLGDKHVRDMKFGTCTRPLCALIIHAAHHAPIPLLRHITTSTTAHPLLTCTTSRSNAISILRYSGTTSCCTFFTCSRAARMRS